MDIEEKYRPELKILMNKVNNINLKTHREDYFEAVEKYNSFNEKVMAEREAYYKHAELRIFNSFKGDIKSIVVYVKNQVLNHLYNSNLFEESMSQSPIESETIDGETIEKLTKELRQTIIDNEKLIKKNPNDEKLKKSTQLLREMVADDFYEPLYTAKKLKNQINENLKRYFDFLLKTSPKEYDNLQIYIENAIKNKDNIILGIEKKTEDVPNPNLIPLKSIVPNTFIIPNNKMANQMTNDLLGEGEIALTVIKGSKEVLTIVSVNYDDEGIQIYNKQKFTPYDREVCNSVTSLSEAGNNEFTPLMVYRCMNGLTNNEKVSPQAIGAVTKSIDKVSRMSCKIDWTVEAKRRNANVDETIISGNILATEKITVRTGGKKIDAYTLLSSPIMYRYAKATNQVISVPIKLLETKEATRSTEDVIVIRGYLIRRIEVMKNPKNNMTNRICYESIYEELGLNIDIKDQSFADKTAKIRKAIKELLLHWKGEKYIKDFSDYKLGKRIEGIDIFY